MKLKAVIPTGFLLALLICIPGSLQAQCEKCFDNTTGLDWHQFGPSGATIACAGECEEGCHTRQGIYGICTMMHNLCTEPEDVDRLAEAIRREDFDEVGRVFATYGNRARYNESLVALELLCGDAVFGRVEVPESTAEHLRSMLAETQAELEAKRPKS